MTPIRANRLAKIIDVVETAQSFVAASANDIRLQLNSEQSRIGAVELDSSKAKSMSSEAWNNRYTSMVTPSGGTGDDLDKLSINFCIKLLEEKEKEPGGEAVELKSTGSGATQVWDTVKGAMCCSYRHYESI